MLIPLISLLAAALAPIAPTTEAICTVGRAALRDLPGIYNNYPADSYYAASDSNGRDLLNVCPKLKNELPIGYSEATDDAHKRANIHAPVPGYSPRPAYIYSINVPKFSADLKSATVHFEYTCTGLCGGAFEAHYALTQNGWQRRGALRTLYVS